MSPRRILFLTSLVLTAATLALCLQAPLRAEEKPLRTAENRKLSAEEQKLVLEADASNQRAIELQKKGSYTEAEKGFRAVLSVRELVQGPDHPDTIGSLNNLGNALKDQGRNAEAEQVHREVLAVRERLLGAQHPDVFRSCFNLARSLEAQGKLKEALAFMQRAETGLKKIADAEPEYIKAAQQMRERIEAVLKKQEAAR